jgi:hypothetical protein
MREERWGGEGKEGSRNLRRCIPSMIGISTCGEHDLRGTVAAAVITNLGDVALCSAFDLATRGGLSPFFMRSEKGEKLICSYL